MSDDRTICYIVDRRDGTGPELMVLPPRGDGPPRAFKIDTLAIARLGHECAEHLRKFAEHECRMSGHTPGADGGDSERE